MLTRVKTVINYNDAPYLYGGFQIQQVDKDVCWVLGGRGRTDFDPPCLHYFHCIRVNVDKGVLFG